MATLLEDEFASDSRYFHTNLNKNLIIRFRKISSASVHLHLLFSTLFLVAIIASIFSQSIILAVLASLTCFTYLVLLFYYQARKPEQLKTLIDEFVNACCVNMNHHHLSVAESLSQFSSYLEDFEWGFYKVSSPLISRFSAYCYWEDVFTIKKLLLHAAMLEYIQQIRLTPTNIEVHASLAGAYVMLSKLYRQPIQNAKHPKISSLKKHQINYEEKAKRYSLLAIEEFKIISHYAATDDPWVHEQMAIGYKDLNLPAEELKEVEILLTLRPQDKDILFRLGTLYFGQGQHAKGLLIYEELKRTNSQKAETLLAYYGQF